MKAGGVAWDAGRAQCRFAVGLLPVLQCALDAIEFTFSGDKVSRLDLTSADQAAEDAFWG
jgi:hypothetical protein